MKRCRFDAAVVQKVVDKTDDSSALERLLSAYADLHKIDRKRSETKQDQDMRFESISPDGKRKVTVYHSRNAALSSTSGSIIFPTTSGCFFASRGL